MINRTPGLTFEIDHLRAFITWIEAGTQHKAAKALHISQPCLCKKLSRLQSLVNVTLWNRVQQVSFELTPAGLQFLEEARRIVDAVDELAARRWNGEGAAETSPSAIGAGDRGDDLGIADAENSQTGPKTDVAL